MNLKGFIEQFKALFIRDNNIFKNMLIELRQKILFEEFKSFKGSIDRKQNFYSKKIDIAFNNITKAIVNTISAKV